MACERYTFAGAKPSTPITRQRAWLLLWSFGQIFRLTYERGNILVSFVMSLLLSERIEFFVLLFSF